MRWVVMCAALCGCGRIAFEPLDTDNGGSGGDGGGGGGDATGGDGGTLPAPIAWWKLDENTGTMAMDSIGSAHGTLGGTTLPMWTATAHAGTALAFSGTGQRVAIGTPASLAALASLSIVAWIRPTALTPPGCIMDKSRATDGWLFAVNGPSAGALGFFSMFQGAMYTEHQSTPDAIAINVWNHVAVTWDGSGTAANIRLYVNAAEVTYAVTVDATGLRPDDSNTVTHINCFGQTGFAGTIDDVRVFDRVLAPQQIAQLHAQ